MKVLVVNAGSSSLKYQLINMDDESVIAKGICERIGFGGTIEYKMPDGTKIHKDIDMPTHAEAFDAVMSVLTTGESKVIDSVKEIDAVGHRIVHGGTVYSDSVLITEDVIKTVEGLSELAPLHNPANILGIRACIKVMGPDVPQVGVFDTSFHQTMPAKSYMFALPYEYYEKYGVRKYGFHGTSHKFVSERCYEILGNGKKGKVITCHLGNGCSISAVKDGKCMDTSMGFTPLDGFMMGTRCGTMDPSVITYLMRKENLTPDEMENICNKKSGLLGVSGKSHDNRDIIALAAEGDKRAALAFEMQNYQMTKTIGSYVAAMSGVDAIVFTAGIGENEEIVRRYICEKLEFLGFELDKEANNSRSKEVEISKPGSKVRVFVIPTNEELAIARDTVAIVNK